MDLTIAMKTLEAAGTEQNRKIYRRHGAREPMFGVSWSVLRDLAKRIGPDQPLAEGLRATGNHDARVLACLVADPAAFDGATADAWLAEVSDYAMGGQVCGIVAHSPVARAKCDEWRGSPEEWRSSVGWGIVAHLAMEEGAIEDAWGAALVEEIRRGIATAPNRTRHEMNMALIALGGSKPRLEKVALAAAKAIGEVVVDHGETGCVTPDATAYIRKMAARRAGKKKPAAKAAKTARKAENKPKPKAKARPKRR